MSQPEASIEQWAKQVDKVRAERDLAVHALERIAKGNLGAHDLRCTLDCWEKGHTIDCEPLRMEPREMAQEVLDQLQRGEANG